MEKTRGFTLIETLVAIAILLIIVTIPYYSVERALVASYVARDQLVAVSLAEEGLEFVQGVRDANAISKYHAATNYSWVGNLDGTQGNPAYNSVGSGNYANCVTPNACAVDPNSKLIQQCSNATCSTYPLYLVTTSGTTQGEYTLAATGNTRTRFTRYVQIQSTSATEELVTVTVTWTTEGVPYHVTISEYLENWQ